jgi:hypothetical protein
MPVQPEAVQFLGRSWEECDGDTVERRGSCDVARAG